MNGSQYHLYRRKPVTVERRDSKVPVLLPPTTVHWQLNRRELRRHSQSLTQPNQLLPQQRYSDLSVRQCLAVRFFLCYQ